MVERNIRSSGRPYKDSHAKYLMQHKVNEFTIENVFTNFIVLVSVCKKKKLFLVVGIKKSLFFYKN